MDMELEKERNKGGIARGEDGRIRRGQMLLGEGKMRR